MLKTSRSFGFLALEAFRIDNNKIVEGSNDGRDDETVIDLSKFKILKNIKSKIQTHIGTLEEPKFLTFGNKETFNRLKQAFIKAPIL